MVTPDPKATARVHCACGHSAEEHGHGAEHPGSTACDECPCIAYEADYG